MLTILSMAIVFCAGTLGAANDDLWHKSWLDALCSTIALLAGCVFVVGFIKWFFLVMFWVGKHFDPDTLWRWL